MGPDSGREAGIDAWSRGTGQPRVSSVVMRFSLAAVYCCCCCPTMAFVDPAVPAQHVWGCLAGNISARLPFCDTALTIDARVSWLLANLSLPEKVGLLNSGPSGCGLVDAGVPRLGIPPYKWGRESNSGPGGQCLPSGACPSQYPGNTGVVASFNRTVWRRKGEILSTEMRALENVGLPGSKAGINGWGPNINILRVRDIHPHSRADRA